MNTINGTNLGNWLVLEHWMSPHIFEGVEAVDEIWLGRDLSADELARRLKEHRDTYVTEDDFAEIAKHGLNLVRIPVPYFIFGDRPPYPGCVEYLDKAFDWAEKYGLQIMIDLHTVPGSQNGYDNGGLTGVCKWCKDPKEVDFAISVLDRLAARYAKRPGLYGIEVLNEPISWLVYVSAPSTGKARDKEEMKGSGHVPMPFLKEFYKRAYATLRKHLAEDKVVVFHDGFRLGSWGNFFVKEGMKNVILDTHIYVFAMENFVPIAKPWVYKMYVGFQRWLITRAQKHTPVVVGEWCICNKYAENAVKVESDPKKANALRRKRYQVIHSMQMAAWEGTAGQIYWNYQLRRDRNEVMDQSWKESWDLSRCWKNGWVAGNP